MRTTILTSLRILAVFTLLTGVLYPLAVTGLAQLVMPEEASGSLLQARGKTVGSSLIGQEFSSPHYLWGRPSATAPFAYNAAASSGSNLGPLNPALAKAVQQRVATLRAADPLNQAAVPSDLVCASASGLDPEISAPAAAYQVARIARVRGASVAAVEQALAGCTREPMLGIIGPRRVHVLCANVALDQIVPQR
jgi:K+-transporting ATPase ATPase C chain